jgi:hypothetical protein
MPNHIKIQEHPEATSAMLRKIDDTLAITFTGRPGIDWKLQLIESDELGDAIRCGFSDEEAVTHIEQQIAVAGSVAHRLTSPRFKEDAAEWSLTFMG